MMNRPDSSAIWWRYALVWSVTLMLTMACQNWRNEEPQHYGRRLAPTNPTRVRINSLEETGQWGRLLSFYRPKGKQAIIATHGDTYVLGSKEGALTVLDPYKALVSVVINGQEAALSALSKIAWAHLEEVFVLQELGDAPTPAPKPYQLLIQTSDLPVPPVSGREAFLALLKASVLSEHPLGTSHTYTMNGVLEATFFHYKDVFVERTKNQHLRINPTLKDDILVYIDGTEVEPQALESVHVRDIHRLYTRERPYNEWLRADYPDTRYVLYVQTAPNRTSRDSSYYVFSPFYSGDF